MEYPILTPNGSRYSILLDKSFEKELIVQKIPFLEECPSYESYLALLHQWKNEKILFFSKNIMPFPISGFLKRFLTIPFMINVPKSKRPVVMNEENLIHLQKIVISCESINVSQVFPDVPQHRQPIPITNAIFPVNRWDSDYFMPFPDNNMFDKFDDYSDAVTRWTKFFLSSSIPNSAKYFHEIWNVDMVNNSKSEKSMLQIPSETMYQRYYGLNPTTYITESSPLFHSPLYLFNNQNVYLGSKAVKYVNDFIENGVTIHGEDYQNFINVGKMQIAEYYPSCVIFPDLNSNNEKDKNRFAFLCYQALVSKSQAFQFQIYNSFLQLFFTSQTGLASYLLQNHYFFYSIQYIVYEFICSHNHDLNPMIQRVNLLRRIDPPLVIHGQNVFLELLFSKCLFERISTIKTPQVSSFASWFIQAKVFQATSIIEEFPEILANWMSSQLTCINAPFISLILAVQVEEIPEHFKKFIIHIPGGLIKLLFDMSIVSPVDFNFLQQRMLRTAQINLFLLRLLESYYETIGVSCFDYTSPFFVSFLRNCFDINPAAQPQIPLDVVPALITRLTSVLDQSNLSDLLFRICRFLKARIRHFPSPENHRIVSTSLSLLMGPFSSMESFPELSFRSFEKLFLMKEAESFHKQCPNWDISLYEFMNSANISCSSSAWRLFFKWITKFKDIISFICSSQKRTGLIISALRSANPLTIVTIIKYLSRFIEKNVEPDIHRDNQSNKAGFIFMLAGIPNEILELAAMFKEASFSYNEFIRKAASGVPPENIPESKRILIRSNKIMNERNACKQVFNGKVLNRK